MYADLPGVTEERSLWARCMAVQTVNFMLGDNADEFSYMVGFGCGATSCMHVWCTFFGLRVTWPTTGCVWRCTFGPIVRETAQLVEPSLTASWIS